MSNMCQMTSDLMLPSCENFDQKQAEHPHCTVHISRQHESCFAQFAPTTRKRWQVMLNPCSCTHFLDGSWKITMREHRVLWKFHHCAAALANRRRLCSFSLPKLIQSWAHPICEETQSCAEHPSRLDLTYSVSQS